MYKGHDCFVDWFHAVQAMISIGLIMLLISLLLIAIYMCIHTVSKNSTIIALVCFCFLSGEYLVIWLSLKCQTNEFSHSSRPKYS